MKEVYLLDIKRPEMKLPYNKKVFIFDINKVDKESLPFEDDSFDTVILRDVIENLYYPLSLIKDVHRITKKRLIIMFPQVQNIT